MGFPTGLLIYTHSSSESMIVGKRGPPPPCRDFGGLRAPGNCAIGELCRGRGIYSTGKRELFHDDFCRVTVLSAGTYNASKTSISEQWRSVTMIMEISKSLQGEPAWAGELSPVNLLAPAYPGSGLFNSYNISTVPILYVRVALQLLGEQKLLTVSIRYWLEIIIFNFLITTL